MAHGFGDGLRGGAHILQVRLAIHPRRCANADEDKLRFFKAFFVGGGEAHAAGFSIAQHRLGQSGFVYRHLPGLQHVDLARVDVNQRDPIAHIRETSAGDQTDIAGPNYAKLSHVHVALVSVFGSVLRRKHLHCLDL